MKNILNWTVSSFFRTIGRILAYIGIGFLIFIIISKIDTKGLIIPRLYALSNYDYKINYDYNAPFVLNNNTSSFFGENGYLEDLRSSIQTMIDNNISNPPAPLFNYNWSYFIGFTKNDIYVIVAQNQNSEFYFNIGSNLGTHIISFYQKHKSGVGITGTPRKYWKLSDYNTYTSFKNAILNNNGGTGISEEAPVIINSGYLGVNDYSNYNYFDNNINDYFIPYYSNRSILSSCESSLCGSNINYRFEKPIINGIDTYVPSFYSLYNDDIPDNSTTFTFDTLYKNVFTINALDIDSSWIYNFDFNYIGNIPSIDHIDYYGLVNDNGLYHYELINDKISFSTEYPYAFVCENGLCQFSSNNSNIEILGNISGYSKIYFDIVYSSAIHIVPNSFNFYRSQPFIIDSLVNDVCSSCLYVLLESSSSNTYTFSNSDSSKSTLLFYNNIPQNDAVYNLPSYIDFSNGNLYNSVYTNSNEYYYGTFNRVLNDNYSIANNIGLIMNIYSSDLVNNNGYYGTYQIMYFITPNLYWSDSVYSEDKNNVSYDYIDNNGNKQSGTATGDFHNAYSEINLLPQFDFIKSFISDDMYGLSGVINTPLNKIKTLLNYSCSPISLPIPYTNSNITIPCLSSIYNDHIPAIINIWHIVLYGVVGYYIAVGIFRDIKNTIEADKNDIEVIQL